MNQLTKVFEDYELTIIEVNGEPKFLLKDVCDILGLGNSRQVRTRLEDDVITNDIIIDNLGREQQATFVNEDGLYDVILDSRKPEAKNFRKWITSEVIPSIRKTGGYKVDPTELLLETALEQRREIKVIKDDVSMLKGTMRVSSLEQQELRDAVNRTVVRELGGKESPAYKNISRVAFSSFWKEFKQYFHVPRYGDLPTAKFKDGLSFAENWKPNTPLQMDINSYNDQSQLL